MPSNHMRWRKSSHSAPDGDCVEAGTSSNGTIGVRDTKTADRSSILEFTSQEWAAFLNEIRTARLCR